jgi:hypothetical protein
MTKTGLCEQCFFWGLATACLLLSACDLEKIGSQATAKSVAAGAILATPSFVVQPQALAPGGEAGLPFSDGGLGSDAGMRPALTVPPQTRATFFFGQRQGTGTDLRPTGTAGASVTLSWPGGTTVQLKDEGGGNYSVPEAAQFQYQNGATYTFEVVLANEAYSAQVADAPVQEVVPRFHEAAGFIDLPANSPFTFSRPPLAPGQSRPSAFVSVFPLDIANGKGAPTYSTVPQTPLDFLKLALFPSEFKQDAFTIPATAFPDRQKNYIIVLQSVKFGGPRSNNLFTATTVVAGTSDVGIVKTR